MIKNLIALKNPKSRAAEAYRTLRTNIQFSSLDENVKTIVVTSSGPGEGKSTVMSNLAVTMAQSGKRVLLLDCDLRKPTIHKKFGIPNSEGLTNILGQSKKIEECIYPTSIENLFVLTSGPTPPNPAELLGTKRMLALISNLKDTFDIILIDAPPVLAVTDAQILSTLSDGVLLLASYGHTEKAALMKAKELLNKVGSKILGVVFNKVPEDSDRYYYSKYYSYYSHKED